MANRLSNIATRTGDDGTTGLGDGTRVSKASPRVAAMGDVDELNSQLGVLLAEPLPIEVRQLLVTIQHELFNLGGELSIPGYALLKPQALALLDEALATHNASLPRLAEFILPAGRRATALTHVARAMARRAERAVIVLTEHEQAEARQRLADVPTSTPQQTAVRAEPRLFLNRLSDLLFVLARVINRAAPGSLEPAPETGGDDVYWRSDKLARDAGNTGA